ncbi:RIP metalloprotease [uncultured Brevibacterium sp.]|uniref:M50 family metallopeptidase n=1 Tax=uncultured Brevibacterium sp. TaxID=189678 RepID=UPI0025DCE89E|nr:site-2 protease family protein [uncultured Brevibacterium sp.]
MTILLYILGVILFLAAIGLSIGLHEIGHLVPAKKFGVKVTDYMIGFGPTLVSFKRGETRYGIKLLPLGGFIAMPGMYPPKEATHTRAQDVPDEKTVRGIVREAAKKRHANQELADSQTQNPADSQQPVVTDTRQDGTPRKGRLFENTLADAREFSNRGIEPGEEHRTFYALNLPKRLVVMFGGPFMNLLLGIGILALVLLGIGVPGPSTTVATVVECAVPASEAQARQAAGNDDCTPKDQLTPAWETGIKPGDKILEIGGTPVESWDHMTEQIRAAAGTTVPIKLERDGQVITKDVPIITSERPKTDENGSPITRADGTPETEQAGFLGVSPTQELTPIPVSEFPGTVWSSITQTFSALFHLPQRLVEIGQIAINGGDRPADGPIGVVGIGRVAGEIVSTDLFDVVDKIQLGLSLVASLNFFLFAFNLVPLLPLDGGHIAVALYEGARRRINLARGRGIVGPFDTARLLPLTYGVVGVMLVMTLLLLYVDLFNPITLRDLFGG